MKAAALVLVLGFPALAQDSSGLDRLDSRDDLRGWEAIGRVDVRDGGFCTGTLIAPDLVLTAAHCVINDDGSPVPAGQITFRAGLANGSAFVEATIAQTVVDESYRKIRPAPMDMVRIDVALLQLAAPVPATTIAPFTVGVPDAGEEVSVVSYADGREDALSLQRVCNVVARHEGLIAVDCDVSYGSSGAPVLDNSGGYRARIVSIISVGSTFDGKRVAVGMELPSVVDKLKASLRSGKVTSSAVLAKTDTGSVGKRIPVGGGNDTGARFVKP
jgi:protease YdgD